MHFGHQRRPLAFVDEALGAAAIHRVIANMQLGAAGSFKLSKYPKANPFGAGPIPDKFRLMPIPQRAIDVNPSLAGQQNPGW